jgi:hypothetical protein
MAAFSASLLQVASRVSSYAQLIEVSPGGCRDAPRFGFNSPSDPSRQWHLEQASSCLLPMSPAMTSVLTCSQWTHRAEISCIMAK